MAAMEKTFNLMVNGERRSVMSEPDRLLLDVLREDLQLTGVKYGCGEGECGACTVLVEGKRQRACQLKVAEVADQRVVTIEGLAHDGKLHPVQEAFLAEGAMQCGYCTPGMVLSTVALLAEKPKPSAQEILAWLDPQLCRCGGYTKILRTVQRACGLAPDKQ
jgi:aerobic-type carbon monoxide dehydrogenase small subunit (CoxS/CutS family)